VSRSERMVWRCRRGLGGGRAQVAARDAAGSRNACHKKKDSDGARCRRLQARGSRPDSVCAAPCGGGELRPAQTAEAAALTPPSAGSHRHAGMPTARGGTGGGVGGGKRAVPRAPGRRHPTWTAWIRFLPTSTCPAPFVTTRARAGGVDGKDPPLAGVPPSPWRDQPTRSIKLC